MSKRAKPDKIGKEILRMLENYGEEVTQTVKEETLNVAQEAAAKLKKTSPKRSSGYAKGWKKTTVFENSNKIRVKVHDKKYQLTHLLEHGHAKRDGGRVAGIPHIEPIERWAEEQIVRRLKKKL